MHDTSIWAGHDGLAHRPRGRTDLQSLSVQTFEIDVERKPDRPVVAHVIGPVDLLTAPAVRMCVDDNVDDDRGLVLDFSRVDFLAASGLTVLTDTEERANREHLAWALVANSRPVIRPHDSLPRAVSAVATVSGRS
jgi:anti-sigma B factor antagonist